MIKTLFIILIVFSYSIQASPTTAIKTKPDKDKIALTFDDGPDPRYTPKILKILKHYNIKATFFVQGSKAKLYPHLIKQVYEAGHVIANHTMTHPKLPYVSERKMRYEITETNKIVENIIGYEPKCLRPPFGMHNKRIDKFLQSQDMAVVTWDLNSFDYKRPGVQQLTNWVLTKSKPGDDILLHDGGGTRTQTVKALPLIIEGFQKRGIGFDTICN